MNESCIPTVLRANKGDRMSGAWFLIKEESNNAVRLVNFPSFLSDPAYYPMGRFQDLSMVLEKACQGHFKNMT